MSTDSSILVEIPVLFPTVLIDRRYIPPIHKVYDNIVEWWDLIQPKTKSMYGTYKWIVSLSFHLPTLECPGLEKSEVSWTSLDPPEAGDEGMGARSPPGEESKRLEEGELPGAPRWLRRAVREKQKAFYEGDWKKTGWMKGWKLKVFFGGGGIHNFYYLKSYLSCTVHIFLVLAYKTICLRDSCS